MKRFRPAIAIFLASAMAIASICPVMGAEISSEESTESNSSAEEETEPVSEVTDEASELEVLEENAVGYNSKQDNNDVPNEESANQIIDDNVEDSASNKGETAEFAAEEEPETEIEITAESTVVHEERKDASISFAGGNGTAEDPYKVKTAAQLDAIRNDLSACYVLVSDIDLSGKEWNPIASEWTGSTVLPFMGEFNGNNHIIENMTIYSANVSKLYGLFGFNKGNIKNVYLKNCKISLDLSNANSDSNYIISIGAVAGRSEGNITSCRVSGSIEVFKALDAFVGGIVGYGNVGYSTNNANISVYSTEDNLNSSKPGNIYCGGLTGESHSVNGSIINCVNNGIIYAESDYFLYLGGISGADGGIKNCVNNGSISGESIGKNKGWNTFAAICNVGGIVGATSAYTLDDCVNFADISGTGESSCYVGGIGGWSGYYSAGSLNNCYNVCNSVYSSGNAARVIGTLLHASELYSINTTLVNGAVPTENIGKESVNGESLNKAQISEAIRSLLSNLNLSWNNDTLNDPNADSDGDGILDGWEFYGIDADGDGAIDIDLPKMGADPNTPDIFVEVDWMTGKKPRESSLRLVYNQFKSHGINIHIDVGPDSVDFVTGNKWGSLSGGNSIAYSINYDLGNGYENWNNTVINNFSKNRSRIFRHCLFVDHYYHKDPKKNKSSGIANNIPGQYFIIADVDGWISSTDIAQAGTFMHELGHTLGLKHGGSDSVNGKPNYLSVMNYSFQTTGLVGTNTVNYSDYVLPEIDENNINEMDGFDPYRVTAGTGLGTKWYYYHVHQGSQILRILLKDLVNGEFEGEAGEIAGNPLDINYNSNWDTSISEDVNNDGKFTKLSASINDWENISFRGGSVGAGISLDDNELVFDVSEDPEDLEELTEDEAIELNINSNDIDDLEEVNIHNYYMIIDSGSCGDNINWFLTQDGTLVISGTGDIYDYQYPSYVRGNNPNAAPWYDDYADLITEIVINGGINRIGNNAFSRLKEVSKLTLPNSLQTIGQNAFSSVAITDISIPDQVVSIGDYAFSGCEDLNSVTLPDSVMTIGKYAFNWCESLQDVRLSEQLSEIPDFLFDHCKSLKTIVIPESVKTIGGAAFQLSGVSNVSLPSGLTTIRAYAFGNCQNLETIDIPDSVTELEPAAFINCKKLSHVSLSEGLTVLWGEMFFKCESLESIIIPQSVSVIKNETFEDCASLKTIVFRGDAPEFDKHTGPNYLSEDDRHFKGDTLTAYYPAENSTWTSDKQQDYGGSIDWKPYYSDISKCTAYLSNTRVIYTGKEQKPEITINNNGLKMENEVDFKIAYSNNIDTGTAKVIITGTGDYTGIIEKTFSIIPRDITPLVTLLADSYVYTGSPIIPSLTVSYNGMQLKEGVDYNLAYDNNIEPGTASVTISCIGNYSGSATKEFTINKDNVLTGTWQKNSKGWWYSWSDGTYSKNKFESISGKTYYFNSSGYMVTGWQSIGGKWYYFNASGAMMTGWQSIGGKWYYMNSTGVMQTGLQNINGKTYYFSTGGAMATGWQKINNKWYYFSAGGAMVTGWQKISNKWYYFDANGVMLTGWQSIGGKWYYFEGSGVMAANKWVGNYYLTGSGAMATNTWIGKYYVGADGKWIPNYKAAN